PYDCTPARSVAYSPAIGSEAGSTRESCCGRSPRRECHSIIEGGRPSASTQWRSGRRMEFMAIEDIVARPGLRLVLVRGTPSPWGQAAKAMMEYKGLDFVCAGQLPGAENAALVAWAGINSGPV